MVDIKPEIMALLKQELNGIKVTYSRPKEIKEIPCITVLESNNAEYNEFWNDITFTVDIWHKTQFEAETIAKTISGIFKELGFRRTSKLPISEEQVERINLTFTALVDSLEYISK